MNGVRGFRGLTVFLAAAVLAFGGCAGRDTTRKAEADKKDTKGFWGMLWGK